MSNFTRKTFNPQTGLEEDAEWLDDYSGHHLYGVRFKSSDRVYSLAEILFYKKQKEQNEQPKTRPDINT